MEASLRNVIDDMLNKSGNTVVRAAVNGLLGGPEKVNERFAAHGLTDTTLTVLGPNTFWLGDSTAHDSLLALNKIVGNRDNYSRFMQRSMESNIFTDFGVRSQLQDNRLKLVNKIGLLDDPEGNNRHDVGVINDRRTGKSYGYAIFTTSPFESTTATLRADQSLKDIGLSLLNYAGDESYKHRETRPQTTEHVELRARL